MDIFGFLTGISPWWWVAAAFVLGVIEILTFSYFLIWPGLAALLTAVMLWMFPEMSGSAQMAWFAVLAVILTLAGRYWVMTRKPESQTPALNNRAVALVGRQAVLIDDLAAGSLGNVEVDGIRWRARLSENADGAARGDRLRVASAEGMVLVLEP
ncbi:MAG: NfeD family protein [Pseudomonadota bacterium]